MDTKTIDWVPVGKVHAMNVSGKPLDLDLLVAVISGITYYKVNVLLDGAHLTGESYHAIANPLQGKGAYTVAAANTHYIVYTDNDKYYFSI